MPCVTCDWIRPSNLPCLLCLLASCVAAPPASEAGEKIRFSGRRGAVELPALREQLLEPSLAPERFSRGGAGDALLAPPGAPSPVTKQDKLQADMLERRKNWMFQRPDDSKPANQDPAESRDEEKERADGKPKSSIDRYLEGDDRKKDSKSKSGQNNLSGQKNREPGARVTPAGELSRQPLPLKNDRENGGEQSAKDQAGTGLPGSERGSAAELPGETRINGVGSFNRLSSERREQQRDRARETQLTDFDKLINPPAAGTQGRGAETFGAGADAARNPGGLIGVRGPQDLPRRNDFPGLGGGLPGGSGPRFSGRDDFRMPTTPALLPAPTQPAEGQRVQPRPTILEIPKRKI